MVPPYGQQKASNFLFGNFIPALRPEIRESSSQRKHRTDQEQSTQSTQSTEHRAQSTQSNGARLFIPVTAKWKVPVPRTAEKCNFFSSGGDFQEKIT